MNDLEVCNWALLKLGEDLVSSLEDKDQPHALRCKALLQPLHWSLLRRFDWKFAILTADLSPLKTDEKGSWYYPLPHRCLRIIEPQTPALVSGGKMIVLSQKQVLPLTYIKAVAIEVADPLYCEAVACKLALELCVRVREAEQLKGFLAQEFEVAWGNAVREANKEVSGYPVSYE